MKSLNILKFEKFASKSIEKPAPLSLSELLSLAFQKRNRIFSLVCGFTAIMLFYFFEKSFYASPLAIGLASFSILNQKRGNLLTWITFSTALAFWTLEFLPGVMACIILLFYQASTAPKLSPS